MFIRLIGGVMELISKDEVVKILEFDANKEIPTKRPLAFSKQECLRQIKELPTINLTKKEGEEIR